MLASTVFATVLLSAAPAPVGASPLRAEGFPKYTFKEGDVWTFAVKAKADIQPYSVGGDLTITFQSVPGLKSLAMVLKHKSEMVVGNDRAPGAEFAAAYAINESLLPNGSGEGALMFGPQLLAALLLPAAPEARVPLNGMPTVYSSKVSADKELTKVSSTAKSQVESYTIDQWVDGKTGRLVKATVVTTNATGKITLELSAKK